MSTTTPPPDTLVGRIELPAERHAEILDLLSHMPVAVEPRDGALILMARPQLAYSVDRVLRRHGIEATWAPATAT